MKYADLFDLEKEISENCKTDYWDLIKPLTRKLRGIKTVTDSIRERLKATKKLEEFRKAKDEFNIANVSLSEEEMESAYRDFLAKNEDAQREMSRLKILEMTMLSDDVDEKDLEKIDLSPIPDHLFHDKKKLRIKPSAYMCLSNNGMIDFPQEPPQKREETKTKSKK